MSTTRDRIIEGTPWLGHADDFHAWETKPEAEKSTRPMLLASDALAERDEHGEVAGAGW